MKWWDQILVFWMLSFKPTFSLSSFTFIKRLYSSSSLSVIRVVSSEYLIDISPSNLDSRFCFFQSRVSHDVLCSVCLNMEVRIRVGWEWRITKGHKDSWGWWTCSRWTWNYVIVSRVYVCAKTYESVHFKYVWLTVCQSYFNKPVCFFLKKEITEGLPLMVQLLRIHLAMHGTQVVPWSGN